MTSELHHLAAAYSLDALDDEERRAFEAHYPTCEICSQEVADFAGVAHALAETTAVPPAPELKANVMAEVTQTRQDSPLPSDGGKGGHRAGRQSAKRAIGARLLAAAAAVLLIVGGVAIAVRGSGSDPVQELADAPDALPTSLDPLDPTLGGSVEITWSDELNRIAVDATGFEDPGDGLDYVVWFLLDDGVAQAAHFNVEDGSFNGVLDVDDTDPIGWGINIEAVDAFGQPTNPVLFAGEF